MHTLLLLPAIAVWCGGGEPNSRVDGLDPRQLERKVPVAPVRDGHADGLDPPRVEAPLDVLDAPAPREQQPLERELRDGPAVPAGAGRGRDQHRLVQVVEDHRLGLHRHDEAARLRGSVRRDAKLQRERVEVRDVLVLGRHGPLHAAEPAALRPLAHAARRARGRAAEDDARGRAGGARVVAVVAAVAAVLGLPVGAARKRQRAGGPPVHVRVAEQPPAVRVGGVIAAACSFFKLPPVTETKLGQNPLTQL